MSDSDTDTDEDNNTEVDKKKSNDDVNLSWWEQEKRRLALDRLKDIAQEKIPGFQKGNDLFNGTIKEIIQEFNDAVDIIWFAFMTWGDDYLGEERMSDFIFKSASPHLKDNKEFMTKVLKNCDSSGHFNDIFEFHLSDRLKDDSEFVLEMAASVLDIDDAEYIVENCGCNLYNQKDFVLQLIKLTGFLLAFEYASEDLRGDKEFVLEVAKLYEDDKIQSIIGYVSGTIRDDEVFMSKMVKRNGSALRHASTRLQNRKSIVIDALQCDGMALKFVPWKFKCDPEVVSVALRSNGYTIQFASPDLRNNRHLALEAVTENGLALRYVSPELQQDFSVVLAAVRSRGDAIRYAPPALQNNKRLALESVGNDGWALEHLSPDLKRDYDVVLAAARKHGSAIHYAHPDLQNNKQIALEAVRQDGGTLRFVSPDLKRDYDVVLAAVRKNGSAIRYAPPELQNNKQLALEAVCKYGDALEYLSPDLKRDYDVVLAAVRKGSWSSLRSPSRFASPSLQQNHEIIVSVELQKLKLPPTNIICDQERTPLKLLPRFFQEVADRREKSQHVIREHVPSIIVQYVWKNRVDLIEHFQERTASNKRKRRNN